MRQFKNIFSLLFFSIFLMGCQSSIQKRVMVTTDLKSNFCTVIGCGSHLDYGDNTKKLSKACMKFSIYSEST